MAHRHRLILALAMLLTLPILSGWSTAQAAQPDPFRVEPRSGIVVTHFGPEHEVPLMPGGVYRKTFLISVQVDSVYTFTISLSSPDQNVDQMHVDMHDEMGATLYEGVAAGAGFGGRRLRAGQTDLITVSVAMPRRGPGVLPGAVINETWAAIAQPL